MRTIAIIILALVLIYDFMTVGPMNAAITRAGKTFTSAVVDAGAWAQEKAHDYRVQKRLREAALEHDTAMREVLALEEKETEAGQPTDAPPVPQLKMAMADDFGDSVFSRQAIDSFIQEASALTDIPEDYLAHLAQRESSFDPVAAAGTSSAKGLYQFTESTWLDVFARHGANHGQGALVRYITTENGRPMVVNTRIKRRLLNLRYDPKLSTFMAAHYAREQRAFLTRRLGRRPNYAELYIAHFLGAGGAAKLFIAHKERPNASAVELFPAAARANRRFFYDKNGKGVDVKTLYANLLTLCSDLVGKDYAV